MSRNAKTNDFYVIRQGESAKFFTDMPERDHSRRKTLTLNYSEIRKKRTTYTQGQAHVENIGKFKPARDINAKSAVSAYVYHKGQNAFPLNLNDLIINGKLIPEHRFKAMVAHINESGGIEFYSVGNMRGFSKDSRDLLNRLEDEKAKLDSLKSELQRTIELAESMQSDSDIMQAAKESIAMFHCERLPAQRKVIAKAQATLDGLPDINVTICKQIIGKRHALVQCFDALHRAKLHKESRVTKYNLKDDSLRSLCNQLIVNHGLGQYMSDSYERDAKREILESRKVERARKLKRRITGQGIDIKTGKSVKVFNGMKSDVLVTDSPEYSGRIDWKTGEQQICPDIRYQNYLDSLEHDPLPKMWQADAKPPEDNGKNGGKIIVKTAGIHRKRFAPT